MKVQRRVRIDIDLGTPSGPGQYALSVPEARKLRDDLTEALIDDGRAHARRAVLTPADMRRARALGWSAGEGPDVPTWALARLEDVRHWLGLPDDATAEDIERACRARGAGYEGPLPAAPGCESCAAPRDDREGWGRWGDEVLTCPDCTPLVCPACGSDEVAANTPLTFYACGSSDYDQQPGSFVQRCQERHAGPLPEWHTGPLPEGPEEMGEWLMIGWSHQSSGLLHRWSEPHRDWTDGDYRTREAFLSTPLRYRRATPAEIATWPEGVPDGD